MRYARDLMTDRQYEAFMDRGDADLAYGVPGVGRFRVNVFKQRGSTGIVMRHVKGVILDFES